MTTHQTYRKPTFACLRMAVTLRREARELTADAENCGGKSRQDRLDSAAYAMNKARWLAGKISNEAYRASLS